MFLAFTRDVKLLLSPTQQKRIILRYQFIVVVFLFLIIRFRTEFHSGTMSNFGLHTKSRRQSFWINPFVVDGIHFVKILHVRQPDDGLQNLLPRGSGLFQKRVDTGKVEVSVV